MCSTIPLPGLPPRQQFYNRYCSNKHTHQCSNSNCNKHTLRLAHTPGRAGPGVQITVSRSCSWTRSSSKSKVVQPEAFSNLGAYHDHDLPVHWQECLLRALHPGRCWTLSVFRLFICEVTGPSPVRSEHDHLEKISLRSAGLAVEHVAAIVEVTQVGIGGAHHSVRRLLASGEEV